jgi:hypothetical protein
MFVDALDAQMYDEHHQSGRCYLSLAKVTFEFSVIACMKRVPYWNFVWIYYYKQCCQEALRHGPGRSR